MGVVVDLVMPASLAFIMFALGVGLTLEDFLRVFKHPREILVGLLCQIVLLPAVALALAFVWPLAPEIAIGVVILAAAPGGPTSNLFTRFANGDVALSVSLTAISSLFCVLTVPPIVVLSSGLILGSAATGEIAIADTAIRLFLMATLPVIAGVLFRRMAEDLAIRAQPSLILLAALAFVLVLTVAVLQVWEQLPTFFAQSGFVTLALVVAMMSLSYAIAAGAQLDRKRRVTISIECGLQNATLAIAVATSLFGAGLEMFPAITYGLIAYLPIVAVVLAQRRARSLY